MGPALSYLGLNQDPGLDVPDPRTSLTPRDRKHVTDTWRMMQADVKTNGIAMFINYFQAFPEAQTRFTSFTGVPLSELTTSKRLQAHTNGVMYTLTCVVDHLDDPECLQEMLKKLGENHGRRKITRKHFVDLKVIILELLQDKLGTAMTPEVTKSWDKTIDVIYEGIYSGLGTQL